jgi:hypothetical protein
MSTENKGSERSIFASAMANSAQAGLNGPDKIRKRIRCAGLPATGRRPA